MANSLNKTPKDSSALLSEDLFKSDDNGHKMIVEELIGDDMNFIAHSETNKTKLQISLADDKTEINLTENAIKVLNKRYLIKDEKGKVIESPGKLFRRVAHFIASADTLYDPSVEITEIEERFFSMMANLEFMPNSPTLMNAGRELGQLSACFVLPVEDSMNSIFETVKNTALIHKSGGGTGFSFSQIRPKNDIVQSTKGIASGPISFMQVFDIATETVKQGGTRRGANMAILRVDHPDIMEFIHCKEQNDKLNNFNISVAITDKFWKAFEKNEEYELINPKNGEVTGKLKAEDIFQEIVDHAWKNGEPGVIFIDRINENNPTPHLGDIESTNPCGEQPLLPFESCNLGSINLAKMVKNKNNKKEIDYRKLKNTVHTAVHFLDNIIDINRFPLLKIEKVTKSTRKIGLGVMGFADLLIQLDIPYNSNMAIETATELMNFINEEAKSASQALALKRGEFPEFSNSMFEKKQEPLIRNATRTTIAPTGTISIIAGCSSGIEPLFALSYTRTVMDNDKLPEIHPLFLDRIKKEGIYTEDLIHKVAAQGSIADIDEIPDHIRKVFVTSHDVSPEWHIRMQAAFQAKTDNAVSKTVNFSSNATQKDVSIVYRLAHDLGCKGVTIYRDGSRDKQVLQKGYNNNNEGIQSLGTKKRPRVLHGCTTKLFTGQGSLYVTINTDQTNSPFELFANIGKSGGDTAALAEAIGKLISIGLQKGIPVEEISNTLMGITGSRPVWNEGILVKSVPDGIGQILIQEFGNKNEKKKKLEKVNIPSHISMENEQICTGPECPDCGSNMETEGGCSVCRNCGYSHCG